MGCRDERSNCGSISGASAPASVPKYAVGIDHEVATQLVYVFGWSTQRLHPSHGQDLDVPAQDGPAIDAGS